MFAQMKETDKNSYQHLSVKQNRKERHWILI